MQWCNMWENDWYIHVGKEKIRRGLPQRNLSEKNNTIVNKRLRGLGTLLGHLVARQEKNKFNAYWARSD